MAKIDIFYPFSKDPGPFISQYFDWIFFTCLLLIFFGIVGVALRKQFKDSRALRTLIIGSSLLITLLMYVSIYNGTLDIDPAGFAMYGAFLIFIILFFILFIILQIFTSHKATAFMISYIAIYMIAWKISKE